MNSPLRQFGKRIDDFVYSHAIELLGGGADAYMQLAGRYESLGWLPEAAETYKKAIELRPHQALGRLKLAKIYWRMERLPEAMKHCDDALGLDKDYMEAYVFKGTLHQKLGEREQALEAFRKAMSYSMSDAAAYSTIAKAFADGEFYEEAVNAYKEIIRISPKMCLRMASWQKRMPS